MMKYFSMNDIGKNRTIVGLIAAVAIIVGMLLMGGAPKAATSQPPKQTTAAASAVESEKDQGDQFSVRDYNEYGSGADADLPSADWFGLLAGMVVKLGLVIALIYLAVRVLKRYVYRGAPPAAGNKKPISLLGSLNLSPNRTVYVMEVGRKVIVVGATQSQLNLLTEVTDPDAIQEVRSQASDATPVDPFSSLLNAATRQLSERQIALPDSPLSESRAKKIQEGRDFMQSKLAQIRQSLGEN